MGIHTIALRRPWQATITGGTVTAGAVTWRRRFGRPARLSDCESLWLVVEGFGDPPAVYLNGQRLVPAATGQPARYPITGQLAPRNELAIAVANSTGGVLGDDPPGVVRIEIISADD